MVEESRFLITSGAKGVAAAWIKSLLDGTAHFIGVLPHDDTGAALKSYSGYTDDDTYAAQVARGNVVGANQLSSYGESVSGGALTNQPLAPIGVGAKVNVPPADGVQMSLVSTSANDDKDAGTGVRSVHVHYLDADLVEQYEEVFLEGLTPVTTSATDIRFVQCTHIHTYGSGAVAAGNISVYTTGPVIYSYIETGRKRCGSSFRRVPAGKRLIVKSLHAGCISSTSDTQGVIRFVTTKIDDIDYTEDGFFVPVMSLCFQNNSVALPLDMPIGVESGVIVGMEYDVDKGATVAGGYVGYFEDV